MKNCQRNKNLQPNDSRFHLDKLIFKVPLEVYYEHFSISVVTISSGLVSYPIDTIRRRMMMTSGQAVKYKGSIDCAIQIIKHEGFMSMMKGAGKNTLVSTSNPFFFQITHNNLFY